MGIEPTEPAFRRTPQDLKSRPATRPDSPPHQTDCNRKRKVVIVNHAAWFLQHSERTGVSRRAAGTQGTLISAVGKSDGYDLELGIDAAARFR